ncbi:ATP synthase in type III secretion protein N [Cupriavidus sp. YR651]|uniref:type III secretion system ATPase SctN n=1 Tax=Cupriavidus sp. YR651 TaxID=1855315 RepID=UPI000887DB16|nr:type III secretion system ATPase SctN [Cupriavidus sp. YR651]SDD38723.1 ATP synthase in type III secretion protein N [Cupriavidus sp. YR651]
MTRRGLVARYARPSRLSGPIIEADLDDVFVGEICDVRAHWMREPVVAKAQVIGFRDGMAVLSLQGSPTGLSRNSLVMPTGGMLRVDIDDAMLGGVFDASGHCMSRMAAIRYSGRACQVRELEARPPDFMARAPIKDRFLTGLRAIDGMTACGVGQRIGVFAEAGTGKTTLMQMLIDHSSADVYVVGLIGERGREVTEIVEHIGRSPNRARTVVIYATSDAPSLDRCNAALLATTVAEYFREAGLHVLLLQDSLTRYVRALRDVSLAAGEPPARRGYPASVFEALPRLLERPGALRQGGSITAFYSVLLESANEADPMAEEIRSILDGHIHLSRQLAARHHYPAIDVRRSLSRTASAVCDATHLQAAASVRRKLDRLDELQMLTDLGEFRPGERPEDDRLLQCKPLIDKWLQQANAEYCADETMLRGLHEIAR